MFLVDAGGDFLEAEAGAVLGLRLVGDRDRERAHGGRNRRHAERTLEDVAAVEPGRNDVADGRIVGRVASDILRLLKGLGAGQELIGHGFTWRMVDVRGILNG